MRRKDAMQHEAAPLPIRFYRALLHLYPAPYRRQYGYDMQEIFASRTVSMRPPFGTVVALFMAIADVIPNALGVHLDILRRDAQHALRVVRRSPVLYGASFAILALGIGANGAVFSLLHAVLLRPLPYRDPSSLVMLWLSREPTGALVGNREAERRLARGILTSAHVLSWRDGSRDVFSDVAAVDLWQGNLGTQFDFATGDRTERLRGALVTPNFFELLGVQAALGRTIGSVDEKPGATPMVISHGLWMRAFGGDESIIGRPMTVATGSGRRRAPRTFTIVGVLPREFHFTYPQETEAWGVLSWAEVAAMNPRALALWAVARVKPGQSLDAAQQRIAEIVDRTEPMPAGTPRTKRTRVEPIENWIIGDSRPALLLLAGVSILLFVITCTTVANTLFIRITAKSRELAVRAALGADPRRLVRLLLTEGMMLGLIGATLGLLVALATLPLLRRMVPAIVPRANEIGVSVWIFAFAAAAAAAVVLIAAFMPALRAGRVDLANSLRVATGGSLDPSSTRWRSGLVGMQSAIAACMLVVAVLLSASAWHLAKSPLGFEGDDVLTFEMRLIGGGYGDDTTLAAFQGTLLSRIRAVPGVVEAGITTAVPFRGVDFRRGVNLPGREDFVMGNERVVDSAFFSVMRVNLVEGRVFGPAERLGSPLAVVVSQSFARNLFGDGPAVGQRITVSEQPATVIGVVEDLRYQSLDLEPQPAYYLSSAQAPSELFCIVARTRGNATPAVLAAVREVDPTLPVMNVTTIDRIIDESMAVRRFYTSATVSFALLSLILTVSGLVLIVARWIAERRNEIAIRSALGASAGRLIGMVTLQGLMPVFAGGVVGIVAAFAAARVTGEFLYQVSPREPLVYVVVLAIVGVTGVLGPLAPAFAITRVQPADALRAE
jgi:putative ABC transport system permease protein